MVWRAVAGEDAPPARRMQRSAALAVVDKRIAPKVGMRLSPSGRPAGRACIAHHFSPPEARYGDRRRTLWPQRFAMA